MKPGTTVHKAFFHAINVRVVRGRSRRGGFGLRERGRSDEREQEDEMCDFHSADYSCELPRLLAHTAFSVGL